jgi:poly-gamma-glutamate biosynthesis protein PgsC/CapC
MLTLLTISIGLGLVISLAFVELFGVAAGGMIVPGYIALNLDDPLSVLITLLISYFCFFIVHALSTIFIIYGRRKTALTLLLGFILGAILRHFIEPELVLNGLELTVIGYIIPGLIALWIDRQGVVETIAVLITASVILRLILIIVTGGDMTL